MLYEVYIDVFFAVNAMLDFFVIETVRILQHYRSTKWRRVMASMTGSAVLCIFLCLPAREYVIVRIVFYVGAFYSMAAIAFPQNRKKGMVKSILTLYFVSLLINGIYHWLSLKISNATELLVGATVIYILMNVGWFFYRQSKENDRHIYNVHIVYESRDILLKGLWDTGNRLRSPFHGKGVSVINYQCLKNYISESSKKCMESGDWSELFLENTKERIFLIPYETVDSKHALMPVLTADKMIIEREEGDLEYKQPLLGISQLPVSKSDLFQVILSTDMT